MGDNLFNFCLILTVIVIGIIIFISINSLSKEEYVEVYLIDHAKKVDTNNITFDFSIKSYYFSRKDFEINLYLNETTLNSRTLTIGPREKVDIKENIHLPTNETYLVKASVSPLDEEREASIYFWVNE